MMINEEGVFPLIGKCWLNLYLGFVMSVRELAVLLASTSLEWEVELRLLMFQYEFVGRKMRLGLGVEQRD